MKTQTMMICKMERCMCMCENMDSCFSVQKNRLVWSDASV